MFNVNVLWIYTNRLRTINGYKSIYTLTSTTRVYFTIRAHNNIYNYQECQNINRIDICQTAGRYADPHLKHAKTHTLRVIKYLHHKQHYCFRIRRPNTNRDMTRYSPYLVWVLNSLNIISIISIRLSTIIRKFRFWTTTFAEPKQAGMYQQGLWFVWLTLSICYYHLFPPSTKYISYVVVPILNTKHLTVCRDYPII